MKSVLISIQPKWCEMIASGKKTVEVRKSKPKLDTSFKVYIYCTADRVKRIVFDEYGDRQVELVPQRIIGEFVCDKIFDICIEMSSPDDLPGYPFPCTGLTDKEILQYLGNGKTGYGWHISNLKIYDKPKPLNAFYRECAGLDNTGMCWECDKAVGEECDCAVNGRLHLARPPQSWCYVEELKDGK